MRKIILDLVDTTNSKSLLNKMRRKRFEFFEKFAFDFEGEINILDVGGTSNFWQQMQFSKPCKITLVNLEEEKDLPENITSIAQDARDLSRFDDNSFDLVFSNSMIEHVGNYENQKKVAGEIQRVGKSYYIQTPNRHFFIEPHFVFPFFQFLPLSIQVWLVTHFSVGNFDKFEDKEEAREICKSIQLLSKQDFKDLFEDSEIFEEKFLGMTKSFIAYKK